MDNRQTARELTGKLSQIQIEINAKNQKIAELRQENSKLIEMNLHKERKPPSLRIGREQIFQISNELEELQLTKASLQERLDNANALIKKEQLQVKISQFKENSKTQLALVEVVRRNIKSLETSLFELEKSSGKNHCLYRLLNLCWDFPDTKKEIDLDDVLSDWSPDRVVINDNFDGLVQRLDRLKADCSNFWNQLSALRLNKRSYHKVKPLKPVNQKVGTVQDVRRIMAQEEAKEYRERLKKQPRTVHINHNKVASHG